jgi:branched-chain amino acid transport system ATP-binding protein
MSIVLVEQNARLALRLAHNAYALEHGEVVKSGKGDELLDDPFVRKAYLGV